MRCAVRCAVLVEAIVTGHTARTPQRFVGAAPQSTRRPRRAHCVASSSEMSRWAIIDAASVERLPTPRSHDARRQLCGQSERSSIRGARAASEMRCHDERLSMDSRGPVRRLSRSARRDGRPARRHSAILKIEVRAPEYDGRAVPIPHESLLQRQERLTNPHSHCVQHGEQCRSHTARCSENEV